MGQKLADWPVMWKMVHWPWCHPHTSSEVYFEGMIEILYFAEETVELHSFFKRNSMANINSPISIRFVFIYPLRCNRCYIRQKYICTRDTFIQLFLSLIVSPLMQLYFWGSNTGSLLAEKDVFHTVGGSTYLSAVLDPSKNREKKNKTSHPVM